MIDDRIRDGERIAELLASELTGLETGPLADVAVVDADRGATPTPDGTRAYAVAHADERIGVLTMYPRRACVRLQESSLEENLQAGSLDGTVQEKSPEAIQREGSTGEHPSVDPPEEEAQTDREVARESSAPAAREGGTVVLWVESGAGVKHATDTLRVLLGGD